jgi:RNA polymerase sigma factor (sigma-70 family)
VARVLRIAIPASQKDHEELFAERYEQLLRSALQLSKSDRSKAEDLVHDAYIQFTLVRPDLDLINNLDAYLFGTLRNLHLSHLRRISRRAHRELSIADYDAAAVALRATDQSDQLRLREELHRICRYACARKETSKAGAVLLLRFFHGYYPGEIAQIIQSSRAAVEERLRLARAEAKAYLKDPDSFKVIDVQLSEVIPPPDPALISEGILQALHRQILFARRGVCLTRGQWRSFYGTPDAPAIDGPTLAHLVSCHDCLDQVNDALGLAPLAERHPCDTLGVDTRGKRKSKNGGDDDGRGPGGGGGSVPEDVLRRSRQRAREVFEHYPRELCVAVNGEIAGAQTIGAEHSEQTLHISETIKFVEILSEQDIRLLLLNVDELPPDGPFQYETGLRLCGDRELKVALEISYPASVLKVSYEDPSWSTQPAKSIIGTEAPEARETALAAGGSIGASAGRWWLRTNIPHHLDQLRANLRRLFVDDRVWLRPGAITAMFALVLIAALVFVHFRSEPVLAAELLHRSIVADETAMKSAGGVAHRVINFQERKHAAGSTASWRRIEIWRNAATGAAVRRVYDEKNQLVIGEAIKPDGARRLLSPGSAFAEQAPAPSAKDAVQMGALWRLDASAGDFLALVGQPELARVEEQGDQFVIHYAGIANGSTPAVSEASLILKKADLHCIELRLTIERGGEAWDYDWAESSLTVDTKASIDPELLSPDSRGANSLAESRALAGTQPASADGNNDLSSSAGKAGKVMASAELEVEVNYLLDQVKANLGEQVSLVRTGDNQLRLSALVDTDGRKTQILGALRPVAGNPAVHIKVSTVAEALKESAQSVRDPAIVKDVEIEQNEFKGSELRHYFLTRANGDEARADLELRQFCTTMMGHARQAVEQAAALKRLVDNFPRERVSALDDDARTKLLSMVARHVGEYRRNLDELRSGLRVLSPAQANSGAAEAIGDGQLAAAAERLLQLSYAGDATVRSALALSDEGQSLDSIKSEKFWVTLNSAEKLATAINNAYQR